MANGDQSYTLGMLAGKMDSILDQNRAQEERLREDIKGLHERVTANAVDSTKEFKEVREAISTVKLNNVKKTIYTGGLSGISGGAIVIGVIEVLKYIFIKGAQ